MSAARVTLGIDAEIIELKCPLKMVGTIKDGIATGTVQNYTNLIEQVQDLEFDALAVATPIEIDKEVEKYYWENGGVNPWGGVEAVASKLIAEALNKPVAHAPIYMGELRDDWDFVSDPRMSAEVISVAFLHCVLKGLHKAPRVGSGLSHEDVDFMISPINCVGRPHRACIELSLIHI